MKKIVIGIAPYTRGWGGVMDDGLDKNNPGLFATANPNSVKSSDGTDSGIYIFHEINNLKSNMIYQYFWIINQKLHIIIVLILDISLIAIMKNLKQKKENMLNKRELGGLAIWMASYDAENKITKAMFNSLYGEGYAFP